MEGGFFFEGAAAAYGWFLGSAPTEPKIKGPGARDLTRAASYSCAIAFGQNCMSSSCVNLRVSETPCKAGALHHPLPFLPQATAHCAHPCSHHVRPN